MREEQKHREAFEHYFTLRQTGHNITEAVKQVADNFGFSETTIWKWKKRLRWDEKESIRAAEVDRRVSERLNEKLVDFKVNYLILLNDLVNDVIQKREEKGKSSFTIRSVSDLERIIKLSLLLHGEATDRVEEDIHSDYDPKLIREIGRRLIRERKKKQNTRM